MDELEREGKARRERAQTVALWRYTLVAPAMDEELTARERGRLVRELAAREHPGPFGGLVQVSRKTLDRWIRTRRRGGFEALLPAPRRVRPRTDAAVLALAVSLKKENPARTAAQVRRIMVEVSPQRWAPAERTLQRHFAARGLTTGPDGRSPRVRGRFEADRINEIWTADTLHGPKIAGRKAYVQGIIDDHSRRLVDYQCVYHDDAARFMTLFRHAIATHGIPATLYVDNGSPFIDEALLRTRARLGIRVTHSTPGEPEGRGKSNARSKRCGGSSWSRSTGRRITRSGTTWPTWPRCRKRCDCGPPASTTGRSTRRPGRLRMSGGPRGTRRCCRPPSSCGGRSRGP